MSTTIRIANLDDIHAVYRFICERVSRADRAKWTDDVANLIFQHIKQGLCIMVNDEAGLAAVAMGRPVVSVQEGQRCRALSDWSGDVFWVECLVSRIGVKPAWRLGVDYLISRGARFTQAAWCRMKRGAEPFVFDFATINERFA